MVENQEDAKQLELDIQLFSNSKQQGAVECLGLTFESDEARREYFLEKLREKLKEPDFRQIEGFPIGEDEDILALSDPPYYTACPNPFIEDFIRYWNQEKENNCLVNQDTSADAGGYHREPFAADVSEGKNDPIYNAHSYATKVPPKAIIRYILHYTEPGDVVLDGFCGSGMTGVAAQVCASPDSEFKATVEQDMPGVKWGRRRVILVDLSPAATFFARNHNTSPDVDALDKTASELINGTWKSLGWLYETSLHSKPAKIFHTVWSDVFLCSNCGESIVFWDVGVSLATGKISNEFKCPHCGVTVSKRELTRLQETVFDPDTNKTRSRGKQIPVLIRCIQGRVRTDKVPDVGDLDVFQKSEEEPILDWYPTTRIDRDIDLWYERDYRPLGIYSIDSFYTRRNLRILAALWKKAESNTDYSLALALRFALTGMQINLSRMNRWRYKVSFPYNPLSGTLYVGSIPVESNVIIGFENKISRLKKVWQNYALGQGYLISTNSSTDLRGLQSNSIDYIFTDPPFGSNIIYSDLNIVCESWLRLSTNTKQEAVVHRRKKEAFTLVDYTYLMSACFAEMYRVLKPGRWITIEFHNSKNSVWTAIQEALLQAGFVIADVRMLDKQMQTFKQVTAAGAVKQDLIISAYKPSSILEERFQLEAGTEEGCWEFVRTHLQQLPIFVAKNSQAEVIAERQNYLLFDRMVAFHVQRGVTVPLSAAEFYAGLSQRFSERDGMYFLPEQAAEYDKKRLTVREVLQLELFVTDESSAVQWLKQQLTKKPQTFQELQPQFMQETAAGWSRFEKRLELSELLEQNFLRYDGKGVIPNQIISWLKQSAIHREKIRQIESESQTDTAELETKEAELLSAAKDKWYVPDPSKATDLEKLRDRSLLREFEEYHQSKQKTLKVFRLEAVRSGFKKAWQERDYQTIIEVARKVPETVLQEDPKLLMWYDQALTRVGEEE